MHPIKGHSKLPWHTTVSKNGYEMWLLLEKHKLSYKSFSRDNPYALSLRGRDIQRAREKETNIDGFIYTKHLVMHIKEKISITWVTNARMIRKTSFSTYLVLWHCQPWPNQGRDCLVLPQASVFPSYLFYMLRYYSHILSSETFLSFMSVHMLL